MKKLLIILLLVGCTKTVPPTPAPQPNLNIFDVKESIVVNGQEIQFKLIKGGIYTLILKDSLEKQVITRERFNGQTGVNKRKIYTKTLNGKYLYLVLEDSTRTQISKTAIIIN
jgi:hypothetical protein